MFLNKTSPSALAGEFSLFTSASLTDITAITGPSVAGALGVDRGQIDTDAIPDVVVERRISTGVPPILTAFLWYTGNGAGEFSFVNSRTLPTGALARGEDAIAVADYNLDGHADVCIAGDSTGLSGQNTMYVFLNNGSGSYPMSASATTVGPADSVGLGMRSADFNGDGAPDLFFLHQDTGRSPYADPRGFPNIWMNKNDGSSTFNAPVQLLSNRFHHAEIADMDRDGDPDIVLARLIDTTTPFVFDAAEMVILENTGLFSGTFTPITRSVPLTTGDHVLTASVTAPDGVAGIVPYFDLAIGDYDGNGQLDIAVDCAIKNSFDLRNELFVWLNDTELPGCDGDVNGDGSINLADLNLVLANFGDFADPPGTDGDANSDGKVNLADLNLVLANFGQSCAGAMGMAMTSGPEGDSMEPVNTWALLHGFKTWQAWLSGVEQWEDSEIIEHMEFFNAYIEAFDGPPAE